MKPNADQRIKRTFWGRRNRQVFDSFTGFRVSGVQLDRLKQVCKLLNVDVSDFLRTIVHAISLLPTKPSEIGANMDEINADAKVNPPATSDKVRYV